MLEMRVDLCGQCHVPEECKMRDFVCRPPPSSTRLYCTMIRRDAEESAATAAAAANGSANNSDADASHSSDYGVAFTLYLEFLGGLIPLLKVSIRFRTRIRINLLRNSFFFLFTIYLHFLYCVFNWLTFDYLLIGINFFVNDDEGNFLSKF